MRQACLTHSISSRAAATSASVEPQEGTAGLGAGMNLFKYSDLCASNQRDSVREREREREQR